MSIPRAAGLVLCIAAAAVAVPSRSGHEAPPEPSDALFPAWAYSLKLWPFDLLFPDTSGAEIRQNLDRAARAGANTIIFYIEEEQMYRTFVDDAGWASILAKIGDLVTQAHKRNLKVIVYLNALEVMAHDACDDRSVRTLAREHPDWLQLDIHRKKMAWTCIENDWISKDMEDAWASPYSGFRDLFKRRLVDLGAQHIDGVYIDQASLPGLQDFGDNWGSADPRFAAAFKQRYAMAVPTKVSWGNLVWRTFVEFRHEAVVEYLSDLAATARENGITPFFESSSNDTRDGTLLGNDPALTVRGAIAHSPEIEPEGDYRAAFRMAKFARDINPAQPILYLGWPESGKDAREEFSIALTFSGNYYPTADSPHPANAFAFIDSLQASVLGTRQPYHEAALIYSTRNKDWTFPDERAFEAYSSAFLTLSQRHIPFRILPLETLDGPALDSVGTIVLAGIESISDAEFALLKSHTVALVGENGTRDESWRLRQTQLAFPSRIPISSLRPALPFTLSAPAATMIEYYTDRSDSTRFFIFAFSPSTSGTITLGFPSAARVTVYELDRSQRKLTGSTVKVPIRDYLEIIDVVPGVAR